MIILEILMRVLFILSVLLIIVMVHIYFNKKKQECTDKAQKEIERLKKITHSA